MSDFSILEAIVAATSSFSVKVAGGELEARWQLEPGNLANRVCGCAHGRCSKIVATHARVTAVDAAGEERCQFAGSTAGVRVLPRVLAYGCVWRACYFRSFDQATEPDKTWTLHSPEFIGSLRFGRLRDRMPVRGV